MCVILPEIVRCWAGHGPEGTRSSPAARIFFVGVEEPFRKHPAVAEVAGIAVRLARFLLLSRHRRVGGVYLGWLSAQNATYQRF